MLPDRVSNPGPLTYESGALTTTLRGPAVKNDKIYRGVFGKKYKIYRGVFGKNIK